MQNSSSPSCEASLAELKAFVCAVDTGHPERTAAQHQLLEALTESYLTKLQEKALKEAARLKKKMSVLRTASCLLAAGAALALPLSPSLKEFVLQNNLEYLGIFLGATLFTLCIGGLSLGQDAQVPRAVKLLQSLRPGVMSETAMTLANCFPVCGNYRNQVLAQKRAFRVLDLEVLKDLAKSYNNADPSYVAEFEKLSELRSQGWL